MDDGGGFDEMGRGRDEYDNGDRDEDEYADTDTMLMTMADTRTTEALARRTVLVAFSALDAELIEVGALVLAQLVGGRVGQIEGCGREGFRDLGFGGAIEGGEAAAIEHTEGSGHLVFVGVLGVDGGAEDLCGLVRTEDQFDNGLILDIGGDRRHIVHDPLRPLVARRPVLNRPNVDIEIIIALQDGGRFGRRAAGEESPDLAGSFLHVIRILIWAVDCQTCSLRCDKFVTQLSRKRHA